MKKICTLLFFILLAVTVYASGSGADTTDVLKLTKTAYESRFNNPKETVREANKALQLAVKLKYPKGIAESYRMKGIGEYYLNQPDSALNRYYDALTQYDNMHDERGMAKVYNNIGNLYQMVDYGKALENFTKSMVIAQKYHDLGLIASLYLNMGNIYNRENSYTKALEYYGNSYDIFKKLNNSELLVQCLQNIGSIYFQQHNYAKAKEMLIEANAKAKQLDMNTTIPAINLSLTDLYIAEGNFKEAEKTMEEGKRYSEMINNDKDIYDYKHSAYELELKRKNYEKALNYLINIYQLDSSNYKKTVSTNMKFFQKEQDYRIQSALAKKEKEFNQKIFWTLTAMAALLLVVVGLLINNVKRKATTNAQLQELNSEISRQKDNLDRINHHLEEIIDERTKDLQMKNKKLSDYSSYLSHQIRGPIATLKGLLNLEKEGLVDQEECISMMDKCVSEIDEKIIETSDMLHDDPGKAGF
ncbi:MAG TPA: tetratricopeptide repeat protein [Mucilaginibacter sp.]|jgi:tetratricopeptide (TPR) repeat protein|nr:tetratricopeptide repeat protein [Mucilaginibacter sp.]